jgi:hypothetical protein
VGNDADDREYIRSSKDAELGPSANLCASIKHAVAIMRGGCNMQRGVRRLKVDMIAGSRRRKAAK